MKKNIEEIKKEADVIVKLENIDSIFKFHPKIKKMFEVKIKYCGYYTMVFNNKKVFVEA